MSEAALRADGNGRVGGGSLAGRFACGGGAMRNNANAHGTSEPWLINTVFWGNSSGGSGEQT